MKSLGAGDSICWPHVILKLTRWSFLSVCWQVEMRPVDGWNSVALDEQLSLRIIYFNLYMNIKFTELRNHNFKDQPNKFLINQITVIEGNNKIQLYYILYIKKTRMNQLCYSDLLEIYILYYFEWVSDSSWYFSSIKYNRLRIIKLNKLETTNTTNNIILANDFLR